MPFDIPYDYVVILHLICAVFFLGAITTEVLVLAPLRSVLTEEEFCRIEFFMFRRIRRTYPLFLLPLYGSGFWMYARYYSGSEGLADFISTSFGLLLTVKMTLALGMLTIFALAPHVFMPKVGAGKGAWNKAKHMLIVLGGPEDFRTDRFDGIHYLAFALGLGIIILAKLMFIL